jgi:hypothetical protein
MVKARRKAFYSLVVLVVWHIWLQRNEKVFRGDATTIYRRSPQAYRGRLCAMV